MKRQLLYVVACFGIHLSIQPAKVKIKNKTDQLVFAQINNQKRAAMFYTPSAGERILVYGMSTPFTLGTSPIVIEPVAAIRRAFGVPNFVPILPNSSTMLGTAVFKGGLAGGGYGETVGKGAPITKINFARVKGSKTITGILPALEAHVNSMGKKYGGMELSRENHTYRNDWLQIDTKIFAKTPDEQLSIEVPELEFFTYTLSGDARIRRYKKGTVNLLNWGKAKRVR